MADGRGLPHALLLVGPEGIGKGAFGKFLASKMLCEAQGERPCGVCKACHWFAMGNHPDFAHVQPEADALNDEVASDTEKKKASRQIVIAQIRALEEFVFVGAMRDGSRVVLIEPAEAMNSAAANSLLKILEEPPSNIYFILISSKWRQLLPTVRSRCRIVAMPKPAHAEAQQWLMEQGLAGAAKHLAYYGAAPLLAAEASASGRDKATDKMLASLLEPGRDSLALAAKWESLLAGKGDGGLSMENLVAAIQKSLYDLAVTKSLGHGRFFQPLQDKVKALAESASLVNLIRCYNELIKMRMLANHPLNPRLFLEELAERYLRALASERK